VIADATTLTEAGYVGEDVENIIQKLLQKCDYDVEKAQRGIVYIDEIDKILAQERQPLDHPRTSRAKGVQQGPPEADRGHHRFRFRPQGGASIPNQEFVQVDTTNILFICGGAFGGLEKVIQNRTDRSGMGFGAHVRSMNNRRSSTRSCTTSSPKTSSSTASFRNSSGRLPVVAVLDELDSGALVKILMEPKNALVKQYQKLLAMEGVELEFREHAPPGDRQAARSSAARAREGCARSSSNRCSTSCSTFRPSRTCRRSVVDDGSISGDGKPLLIYSDQPKVAGGQQ
jgi:ATP-dependent Clp protease ATP-binding subunit ClpX